MVEWICRKSRETISGLKSEGEARQQVEKSRRSCFVFDFEKERTEPGEEATVEGKGKGSERRKNEGEAWIIEETGRDGIAGRSKLVRGEILLPLRWKAMAYS